MKIIQLINFKITQKDSKNSIMIIVIDYLIDCLT